MKKLLSVLKNPWLIGITGFLAVAGLIWYIGPLIAVAGQSPLSSDLGRVATIMTVGGAYGLTQLIYYINTLRRNRDMLADLAGAAGGAAGGDQAAAREQQSRDQQKKKEQEEASAEEISTLKQGLDEALGVLKKARLGGKARGGQYLYQLPWYIIIGPPGSGKTTALIHSGLRFPLGAGKVRGVGGTRNCDWWFTDEAVLLDTAGRYTTQDSHEEVDRAAWRGFLDLLKKHRRRRPINGAIVALSLSDLIQQTEDERTAQASAIKQRVQELHEHFGIRFPIYVLFTKADLIAGFIEFFGDLGQEERAQVWGMTLPLDDPTNSQGVVDGFSAEFDLLEQRLHDRLIKRLQEERDPQRRDLIYTLPRQFASLKTVAEQFLREVFRPNRYEERVLLRGVYFTSGTQEGTPIDRLMSSLAATFGLHRHSALNTFAGKGRSYFITRLLREVVFPEAEIAGTNLRFERWRAWIQRGAYAAALLVTATAALLWLTSYARNELYVRAVEKQRLEVNQQLKALAPSQTDPAAALGLLDAARAIPGGYGDRNVGKPWLMGFGLYQGEKLGGEAQAIYQRLLQQALLPRIILRLEERLRQNATNPGYLYDTLKIYLMMDDDPVHFDAKAVKGWMEQEWQTHLPRTFTKEHRDHLSTHLDALLEQAPLKSPIALDAGLIQSIRATLNQVPLSQRIYERIKQNQHNLGAPPDVGLTLAAGPDTPRVFERKSGQPLGDGIPGLYTYQGYYQFFLNENPKLVSHLADESWILGATAQVTANPAERQRVADEVCRLYFGDYLRHWQELLTDVQIKALDSPSTALDLLQVLSGPSSPMRTLIETMVREMALHKPPPVQPEVAKPAENPSLTDKIAGILGKAEAATDGPTIQPCSPDPRLAVFGLPYQRELGGAEGAIPPLDKTLSTLNELYGQMNALLRARDSGTDGVVPPALKEQLGTVVNQVQVDAARKPAPFNTLLGKLAVESADLMRSPRDRLNAQWQAAQIAAFFRDNLSGRYPLARGSIQWSGGTTSGTALPANTIQWVGQAPAPATTSPSASTPGPPDAALTAFSRFFGANGLMDSFFKQYLKPYVDTSSNEWRWRGPTGPDQSITPDALQTFQRAAVIREALFASNSPTPLIRFQLTPLELSTNANEVVIGVDGQTLAYTTGQAARASSLQWTGASGQARLEFLPPVAGSPARLSETGPWAWFKILDQAQLQPLGAEQFRLTFQLGGRQAVFELRIAGGVNPFRLRELEGFRCPEQL